MSSGHHVGHTATFRGRRCVLLMRTGERIAGRFLERTRNMRIRIATADGVREVRVSDMERLLCGNNTREARPA